MEIRKATIDDAAAIARNVLAAMEYEVYAPVRREDASSAGGMALTEGDVWTMDDETRIMLEGMTEICRREDTLYSWRNTLVVTEGIVAGSLTSYDGARYLEMRELTFGLARERFGWNPPLMDDETCAGEWYLDSLAVVPEFRGKGLAKMLIDRMFEEASAQGFSQASLIALAEAPRLIAFYQSFGFRPEGHLNCFGHDYLRMLAAL